MRWLMVLVMGFGLGLLAALGDASVGVVPATTTGQALTIATHLGSVYAAAAVASGALMAHRPLTLLAGPVVLTAAVIGYTGYVDLFVDHQRLSVSSLSGVFGIYLLAALTIGPFLALIGQVAREIGIVGTLARAVVPIGLIAEVAVRYPLHRTLYTLDPTRAWTLTVIILVGVLGAFAATLGHRSVRRH